MISSKAGFQYLFFFFFLPSRIMFVLFRSHLFLEREQYLFPGHLGEYPFDIYHVILKKEHKFYRMIMFSCRLPIVIF